jgi:hypothetical protein
MDVWIFTSMVVVQLVEVLLVCDCIVSSFLGLHRMTFSLFVVVIATAELQEMFHLI